MTYGRGVDEGGYGGGDGKEVTGDMMGKVRVEPKSPQNFITRVKNWQVTQEYQPLLQLLSDLQSF